jgi:hypothetical protein
MLEQYIKNFASEYLEIKKDYLDQISSDDGVYAIDINDSLICTIEEKTYEDTYEFALTVAFGKEEEPEQLIKKLHTWFSRLRLTPWNGIARIITSADELTAGLHVEFSVLQIQKKQELFNRWVHSFMDSAFYIFSGDSKTFEKIPSLMTEDMSSDYKNLLKSIDLTEDQLYENFNRISFADSFSTVIDYNKKANMVMFSNSFNFKGNDRQALEVIGQNSVLPKNISFTYENHTLYLQQTLEPAADPSDKVYQALSRQQQICEEMERVLLYSDDTSANDKDLLSMMSSNLMFI